MVASCMETAKGKEKRKQKRNVYDRNENEVTSKSKKVTFKEKLRRSLRLKRNKSGDIDDLSGTTAITKSKKRKLRYIFCSFRKNVSKPKEVVKELPGDAEADEKCVYEKIGKEVDKKSIDLTDHVQSEASGKDFTGPEININNNSTKDTTVVKNPTKSPKRNDTDCRNKVDTQVAVNSYPESIISSYNVKTRYFLSRLFNIKNSLCKTKNVFQDDKNPMSCSRHNNAMRSDTTFCTLENSQAICNIEKNGFDHFRSSLIVALNDDNDQKRASILIPLKDKDHPRTSYLIPLNDAVDHSRSSILFPLNDDMDLSYLIEYANQAFDSGVYKFENSRDIMGGSESNILDNVSPLYHNKHYGSDVCRSYDIIRTTNRASMRESLHLGDDEEVVIAEGPDIL